MDIHIRTERFECTMNTLQSFHQEGTLYTRRSFTNVYKSARDWLMGEMTASGLSVQIDYAGNIVASKAGGRPDLPALVIGSHTDTVENGGRFDGAIGVLGAIEVVRALDDAGIQLNHNLKVVDFLAEEPSRFGISTVGSRGLTGQLSDKMLLEQDDQGQTLYEGIPMMGGDPSKLKKELWTPQMVKAFLELHIEQGPVLEEEQIDIGIVTGIVGIKRFKVTVRSEGGHAGTVPMSVRHDALVTASKMVIAVQDIAVKLHTDDEPCVGTVGQLDVRPNHSNVIPDSVTFIMEVRSLSKNKMDLLAQDVLSQIPRIAKDANCESAIESLSSSRPVLCDANIIQEIESSAAALGLTSKRLPSGAGHDASKMASISPVGMIFVPSHRGISHTPEEFTSNSQIVNGLHVLAETVYRLDQDL